MQDMINIAIVEDVKADSNMLVSHLEKWSRDVDEQLCITVYGCALDFLVAYKSQFDIIFLDIGMPDKNGVDIAKTIRKSDSKVIIVFTTTMKQYAINGYEVNALDFVQKPIVYERFLFSMQKCFECLKADINNSKFITIQIPENTFQIDINSIVYIESFGHNIKYHLVNGQTIKKRATLCEAEKKLPEKQFARCGVSYLVNLRYVKKIEGDYIKVYGTELKITRSKSAEFRKAFVNYFSNSVGTYE